MAYSIIQTDGSFSSSAMMTGKLKYDVFVSFRGEDTRNNFADHLFGAFQRKGIFAFRDDTNLQKGESLTPELFRAIEESQIFIVVFSKNYASSTWCLRELDYILHYSQVYGRRVLPIFYDVDPSEVRHQKGKYSEAFLKHEQRLQHDPLTVQRWKEALTQMGNISGWDLRHKPQNAEIEKIVQEIMNISRHKENIFISFRGVDTRNNFADHLFGAFQRKGIFAFRDDTKLQKGESIAPELLRAIEGSQIFIVVFSENYASSTWCLQELDKILECSRVYGRRVIPVFYDVDPSEVRLQKGNYAEAFATHEERFQHDPQMVQRWRQALTQVANHSGWDVRHKPQYAEIEKIVEETINILLGY